MTTQLAQMISSAFSYDTAASALPAVVRSRRRRKLWELPARWHCPLIGTCLPVQDMRRLAARVGFDVDEMSDYTLHTAVVGSCDSRSEIADLTQKFLDKRYADSVARFARLKGTEAVLDLWRQHLANGSDIAGALWAVWSHPDIADDIGKELYGDIHMLSHQVGAAARADLGQLQALKLSNAQLRDENQALRIGLTAANATKDRLAAEQQRRSADVELTLQRRVRDETEIAEARQALRAHALLTEQVAALQARIETLEARNAGLARRNGELTAELGEAQDSLAAAEATLVAALGTCDDTAAGCGQACSAADRLAGQCVLCIGGRTGLVDGYRRIVEQRGGQFLHHDGGQEESLHRIDAVVASADAVVCQAGCVSHAAYWRLKEACKKLGKPCVFVKSPGVGSFARSLDALAGHGSAPLLAN